MPIQNKIHLKAPYIVRSRHYRIIKKTKLITAEQAILSTQKKCPAEPGLEWASICLDQLKLVESWKKKGKKSNRKQQKRATATNH